MGAMGPPHWVSRTPCSSYWWLGPEAHGPPIGGGNTVSRGCRGGSSAYPSPPVPWSTSPPRWPPQLHGVFLVIITRFLPIFRTFLGVLFSISSMVLLQHACVFFSRFLESRNYKIQIVARVGRKSAVALSGIMEASYSHFFVGIDFEKFNEHYSKTSS